VGDLYVCSLSLDQIMQYDGLTGEFVCIFAERPPGANNNTFTPGDLAWAPNGHLWVISATPYDVSSVIEYDGSTGAFIRYVVLTTTAEQDFKPQGLSLGGSTGALYMTSGATANKPDSVVYRYEDGAPGLPEIVLWPEIAPEPVMYNPPYGRFASNGNYLLLGSSSTGFPRPTFREFDGQSLAFVRDLAFDVGDKEGVVETPDGLSYLVSESRYHRVDRYDIASGQLVDTFIPLNRAIYDTQDPTFYEAMRSPKDIAFGPNGNVYVCASGTRVQGVPPFGTDSDAGGVHVFDPVTGEQVDLIGHMDYSNGLEWQPEKLLQPHGIEFKPMPGDYASAAGAFNGDWKVDLKDFAKFTGISPFTDQPVLAGPGLACKDAHARLSFDFDRDGDLDLADFAAFQCVFGTTFGE
jgi:hypothetical protein